MKKLLLSTVAAAASLSAMAQLPVSTTPQNRNVVLEEFTGIHCTYCPDGHKIANQIKAANPNDVFLINVHTGGYATPSTGEPDFRTSFGSALAGQTNLAGYPAGTVNRHEFPGMQQNGSGTAMSRGSWSSASNTIMGQASYVNIALDADINIQTRVMTVDLEAYFTGSGAPNSMNINVAVTQDNIEGPQTGGSTYNPSQILPNGNYNHTHALRHLITGQWGDVITTTSSGTLVQKQYTWTIPNSIAGIPVELSDLHVIGFIVEGQQEIITGDDAAITFTAPPGTNVVDLASGTNMTLPSSYCMNTVTPEIDVTNNSTTTACDTFEVSYVLNGGSPVTQQVYTSLAAGASTTITFPQITLPTGVNNITYSVGMVSGTSFVDMTSSNNSASSGDIIVMSPTAFATGSHAEGFESMSLGDETPVNSISVNPDGIRAYVVNQGVSSTVTWPIGGFGNSANSYRWDFYAIAGGGESSIIWENIDFTGITGSQIKFSHAYAQYTTESDRLKVEVSKDCGATWTKVFDKSGATLATRSALSSGRFYPSQGATDWVSNTVSLSSFDGESAVMIKMTGISDNGNSLYVDDINISAPNGINEDVVDNTLNVYPNPVTSTATIDFTLNSSELVKVEMINAIGELVHAEAPVNYSAGQNKIIIDASNFNNGIYFVNVTVGDKVISKKVSILK